MAQLDLDTEATPSLVVMVLHVGDTEPVVMDSVNFSLHRIGTSLSFSIWLMGDYDQELVMTRYVKNINILCHIVDFFDMSRYTKILRYFRYLRDTCYGFFTTLCGWNERLEMQRVNGVVVSFQSQYKFTQRHVFYLNKAYYLAQCLLLVLMLV